MTDDWTVRYDDLRALYVNCTLKRSPDLSNTQGLADRSIAPWTMTSPPACGPT
jgi:hypothetical protein